MYVRECVCATIYIVQCHTSDSSCLICGTSRKLMQWAIVVTHLLLWFNALGVCTHSNTRRGHLRGQQSCQVRHLREKRNTGSEFYPSECTWPIAVPQLSISAPRTAWMCAVCKCPTPMSATKYLDSFTRQMLVTTCQKQGVSNLVPHCESWLLYAYTTHLCLSASCRNGSVGAAEGLGLVAGKVLHARHHQLCHCFWSQQWLQI